MKCSSERARLPLRKSDGHAGIIVTHDFICIRFHILFPRPVGCHSSIAARISISRGERVLSLDALNAAIVFSRRHSRHSRRIENRTWWHLTRINCGKSTRYLFVLNIYVSRAKTKLAIIFSESLADPRRERGGFVKSHDETETWSAIVWTSYFARNNKLQSSNESVCNLRLMIDLCLARALRSSLAASSRVAKINIHLSHLLLIWSLSGKNIWNSINNHGVFIIAWFPFISMLISFARNADLMIYIRLVNRIEQTMLIKSTDIVYTVLS